MNQNDNPNENPSENLPAAADQSKATDPPAADSVQGTTSAGKFIMSVTAPTSAVPGTSFAAPMTATIISAPSLAASTSYEVSFRGETQEFRCCDEFSKLLKSMAVLNMRRRGSNTLDESDYANAYRHLVEAERADWKKDVVAEIGILIAGGFLGCGLPFVFGPPQDRAFGWGLFSCGVVIAVFVALFKHYPHK